MVNSVSPWRPLFLIFLCLIPGFISSRRLPSSGVALHHTLALLRGPMQCCFLSFDRMRKAIDRAKVETYVQDINLQLQKRERVERLLLVMDLGEAFSRSCRSADGNLMLLGNSDKVSLPESILTQLTDSNVAVPWQFVIQKVHRCDLAKKELPQGVNLPSTAGDTFSKEEGHKERLSCASMDFRTQDNFIFLPRWMMDSLDLQPYDVVYLSQLKLPEAIFVRLAPLDDSFFELDSPKAVLEEHLKHFSTLTRGAKIPITHAGVMYHLRVVSIETEDCSDVECASIQDLDVSIDLVRTP